MCSYKSQSSYTSSKSEDSEMDATIYTGNSQIKLINISSIDDCLFTDWAIKAQVVSVSDIKNFPSDHQKKLSVVNLADNTGTIRATLFNDACDSFHHLFELNRVYLIGNCSVRLSDHRFTTIPHKFELNFEVNSLVIPCHADNDIVPCVTFDFVPIKAIRNVSVSTFIDIIGIVDSVECLEYPANLTLRKINLVDRSNTSITVLLWNDLAEKFDDTARNPVLAIKSAKVTEFNGCKHITISGMQSIQVNNPDIPETYELKKWFNSLELFHLFNNISNECIHEGRE